MDVLINVVPTAERDAVNLEPVLGINYMVASMALRDPIFAAVWNCPLCDDTIAVLLFSRLRWRKRCRHCHALVVIRYDASRVQLEEPTSELAHRIY
jgi:hypothetical protein